MNIIGSLIALTAFSLSLQAAAKFPFPQNVKYPYGIKPATIDAAKIQKAYEDFMTLYEESSDKTMARIKWDTESYTVSEGIGYGMMILVYMDNATNNTQTKFDKLWKYYNSFLDPKGLMNWKIQGFTGATGMNDKNSATDADLDVAVGLMEAYKQWGDEKYLTDAKAIIEKISKNDVTADGYLNPGDSWGASPMQYNPSYFSTAALQLFKQASAFDWDKVITNSYSMMKASRNASTGLPPDWCKKDGTPVSGVYKYDAARVPWRIAWAYCWYGHADAKEICSTIAKWITTKTGGDASKVVDGYNIDGTETSEYNNATFVGPFASAGMVDASHQAWLDNAYAQLVKMVATKDVYYQQSLKVITLLTLSGNMPDFWNTTGTITQPANRAVTPAATFGHNGTGTFSFSLPSAGHVAISLHTIDGKFVASLENGTRSAGIHTTSIASSISRGTYIVQMQTPGTIFTKQILLAR